MLFKPGSPLPLPTKTPGSPEDGVAKNENPDQLWFSALRGGRLFEDVSRRFQEMLYTNVAVSVATPVLEDVVFPSDPVWRDKIYMKMVERQRKSVAQRREWESDGDIMANTLHSEKPPKLHEWNLLPKKKPSKPVVCEQRDRIRANTTSSSPVKITWTVGDIAKAGCILSLPPVIVAFDDEQEMRRVYTLVYDVFRYKNILNEALSDVQFFFYYPDLKKDVPKVWLLLYDFYFRNFKPRETRIMEVVKALFNRAHLMTAENALAEQRVKLAAAVARLRIKHSALRLSELLPRHLKNEKMLGDNGESPVTCWINIRKTKGIEEVCSEIQGSLNIKYVEENNKLRPTVFKNDKFCPLFFVFDGSLRTQVAQSSMVRSGKLIMQDRSFCLGPATFGKLLDDLQLTGCVIQTHVNSPRTTAYLANLLSQNEKIKKLMAFSAGQRKQDYEKYFDELGVTNIVIYPEKFVDIPPDANYLEEVIAVFATPPNSYSAVTDPVDLVCSSGGDLTMLEILTESEESVKGRERVTQILEEQKRTLQYAMSRPQIQFVLYETHSELKVENEDMVKQSVMEMNRLAKLHHASVQRKGNPESSSEDILEMKEINNNERINVENVIPSENCDVSFVDLVDKKMIDTSECNEDVQFRDVIVPDCDIFDTPNLPDLCQNGDFCLQLSKEGCYLSLMQRKEIIHFDNKFMIQIAETRGLFGNPSLTTAKSKGNKSANKKKHDSTIAPTKFKRKAKPLEIERICAPTHSSAARNSKHTSEASTCTACPKNRHDPESHMASSSSKVVPQGRRWWMETTHHLSNLRSSLVRQKILPDSKSKHRTAKAHVRSFVASTQKIDEIYAAKYKPDKIPVYPKLRLSREAGKPPKVPLPVAVTLVQFQGRGYDF